MKYFIYGWCCYYPATRNHRQAFTMELPYKACFLTLQNQVSSRHNKLSIFLLFTITNVIEAYSKQLTRKRNIEFLTYKCPPTYATYYCLNGARCFTVEIGNSSLYNCECDNGFIGSRCEYKDLDASYLSKHCVAILQANIEIGAFLFLFFALVLFLVYCFLRAIKSAAETDRCNVVI